LNTLKTTIATVCQNNKSFVILLVSLVSLSLAGCSNKQVLSEQSALQSFPEVASLSEQILQAESADIPLLAPNSYAAANKQFAKAMDWAQANDPKASQFADQGLNALTTAREQASEATDIFEEVLAARQRAIQAGAPEYSKDQFEKADLSLLELTRQLDGGDENRAKAGRATVTQAYSEVELATLKSSTIDRANDAITRARQLDVDDYAPKTLKLAIEEIKLATSVLDADRSNTAKAELHSKTALYHARRAIEIAEIIKNFEASDFEEEDKVLWYQEQLSRSAMSLNTALRFDIPNKDVVKGLARDISDLNANYNTISEELLITQQAKEQALSAKETALELSRAESEKERQKNQEIADKFSKILSSFSSDEADIYRQADNVLIRAHGFQFASGQSQIEAVNFPLLNKIIASVGEFPNSSVLVSGHTDSQGDVNRNLVLSQQRADKVASFLIEVGNIDADRVTASGFGEELPVATNESSAGRAANRRVEILINNSRGL